MQKKNSKRVAQRAANTVCIRLDIQWTLLWSPKETLLAIKSNLIRIYNLVLAKVCFWNFVGKVGFANAKNGAVADVWIKSGMKLAMFRTSRNVWRIRSMQWNRLDLISLLVHCALPVEVLSRALRNDQQWTIHRSRIASALRRVPGKGLVLSPFFGEWHLMKFYCKQ